MIPEKDISLIDRYLNGELSGEELQRFQSRVSSDTELASFLKWVESLKVAGETHLMKADKNYLKAIEAETPIKTSKTDSKRKLFLLVSVFLFTILCMIIYLKKKHKPSTPEQLFFAENFDDYVFHKVQRSSRPLTNLTPAQQEAYGYFVLENFSKATPLLQNLWETNSDTLAYYYLGLSYLAVGKFALAEEVLKSNEVSSYPTDSFISDD